MKINYVVRFLLIILILFGLTLFAHHKINDSPYDETAKEFIKIETQVVIQKIQKRKSGLYYFGFSSCPWCQDLLPLLRQELKASSSKAYLVNTKSDDFTQDARNSITEIYKNYLGGNKLYVPFLIAINSKGDIKVHMGTVEGHDAHHEEMTEYQLNKLKNILHNLNKHRLS